MKKLEHIFESLLWKSRLLVILAVVSSLIGAFALFLAGFVEVLLPLFKFLKSFDYELLSKKLVASAIASIDMFLIATFLLIFALGLYELFISKIDVAEEDPKSSKVLFITNLEDLKTKLGRVVIMVLIVTFFKQAVEMKYKTPLDVLYLSVGALGIALALYFTHKESHNH
ncbi:putative membrane protein YqhA [Hydrogenivirga caldilitoris]|uniref:Putative membrane protein YqhA n=1 Tax=Hydrogenivirga caldilitoris TaxID=246264 RepID=A0A497XWA7_9AQUI|nr:YqhA family protein [Hydrogenivirga caldilitoris]RLJ71053.1 putative membrane protein YqhA [Hydrogenivirga caldilitoris]